jgi:hypothetical protein
MIKTKPKKLYDIMEALAVAIAVDRTQGFIKSGSGYYDFERKVSVHDNKTSIQKILDKADHLDIKVTPEDREQATNTKEYFDSLLVMKKVTGSINGFEDTVGKVLNGSQVDVYGLSILASLPNSMRIQRQRDEMSDFYDNARHNSNYIGTIGQRCKFRVYIKDIKFIAKFSIHLVTAVEGQSNLIKFFWSKDPDVSDLLVGREFNVTGFVKEQSVSKFSNCKETVINRVRLEKIV